MKCIRRSNVKYLLVIFLICLCSLFIGMTATSKITQELDESIYRSAYNRWSESLDSSKLDVAFWLRTDEGPPEHRNITQSLLQLGPNITPFIAEELRLEKNPKRLYRLIRLLNKVSGINLYFGSGVENFYKASPKFRDQFLEKWDAGEYENASAHLKEHLHHLNNDGETVVKVNPKSIVPILRYGVYAIPFIIENIEKHNSKELFAAFLIIIQHSYLYADYIENPNRGYITRENKLAFMKGWIGENENKMNKLSGLQTKIRSLVNK